MSPCPITPLWNVRRLYLDSLFTSYLDISGTHYDPLSLNHSLNLARVDVQKNSCYPERTKVIIRLERPPTANTRSLWYARARQCPRLTCSCGYPPTPPSCVRTHYAYAHPPYLFTLLSLLIITMR